MPWLPAAAVAIAQAAPAAAAVAAPAAAAAAPTFATIAMQAATSLAISAVMSAMTPQVGAGGRVSDWSLSPDGPIPFAAGRVGVAGSVVYPETFGPEKMYYGFISVLSGAGPIHSYESFRGDDEFVTFDGTGKAITSQWANEMWLKRTLGSQPDTALVSPTGLKNSVTLPGWDSNYKLSGKAAYMLILGENSKRSAYPMGEPKPLMVFKGLLCWDPRLDSTWPGGSGSCRLNNPTTWVWSEDPHIWALKWALGLWEGPTGGGVPQVDYQVGGIGADIDGIDVQAFIDAANSSEANDWTTAAYPTTDDDKSQVLDSFLQAGGSIYAQKAGKISCIHRGAPRASLVTITAADTAGPIELDTAASRISRINTLRPRIWSEPHRWQMTAIGDVTNSTWQTEDGGKRPRGIDFPYVTNADQAAQLAALQIMNTREGIAGRVPLKPHLQYIEPGTCFTFDEPGFVLDGLKVLCLNCEYDAGTGIHDVTFVSETDAKYAYAFDQTGVAPPAPTLSAADYDVTPPGVSEWTSTATTFTANGSTVHAIVLDGEVDNPRAQQVIFEFRVNGASEWTNAGAEPPTVTRKEIVGLTAGTAYQVSVSYRIGDRISNRLILATVTTGEQPPITVDDFDTTPPATPGTVTMSSAAVLNPDGTTLVSVTANWPDNAEGDLAGYQVEWLAGGTTLGVRFVTSSIDTLSGARSGVSYEARVWAVDRLGNRSALNSFSSITAGQNATAPTAIISGSVFATGNRQIRVNLKIPADSDYSHALLYRNTTGNSPDDVPQDPIGEVFGEFYIDAAVTIGLNYRYYARSVDRTGNESGIARFLGNAIPVYEDDRTRLRVSVAGSGADRWLRVARVQSSVGRGAARVTLTADGGAFAPSAVVLDVATDWGTLGTVTILSSSVSAPFLQARLTKGTNEAYLDVQIPANSTTDIGIEVTPLPNSGGTWAALYVDSPTAGAQAICSGNLHDGAGNRFIGVISGNGGTSTSTVSSTGGGVQVNGTVGLRGTGDARLAENFINQSRFATATSLSLADADIAAPWSALDSRPAVTQGDSLTEDPAMVDPSAWNTHPTDFAFVTISDGQVARTAFRGTGSTFINLRGAPVDASKTYMIEGWYRRTGSNNTAYGLVSLRDGSGAEINGDGSYWLYHPSNVTVPATWTYYSRVFGAGTGRTIPANAKEMRVGALPNYNGAAGAIEIQGLRIVEVTRIGGNLYRADGSVANESDVVTSLGTSASTNNAPWSVVSGAGRPSDNAGTIGHLRTMGLHTGIVGNKVFKATGGTHGTFQGGAVGTAQNGSAYISGSILSAGLADGWITFFALDDDATTFSDSGQNYYITVFANGVGTGEVALYADGAYSNATGVPLTTNSRATIAYDGQKVMAIVDGVIYLSAPARPGQRLFPKILDYFNSVNSAFPNGVIDVRYGAWTENTVSTVTLVPYNAETSVTGSTATKVGGSNGGWGAGVSSREKYAGAAYCSFRIGPHAQPYMMAGLVNASFGGTYATLNYSLFTEGLPASSGVYVYENGSFVTTISGVGEWLMSDVWSIVYDGVRVQYLRNGVVRHTSAAAAGQTLGFGASQVYINNSLTDIRVGPANQVARLGQNTYDDADGALIGRTNLITSLGTANLVLNQTAAATAPDFLVFNNRTDGGSVSVRSPAGGGYSPGGPVTGCLKIRLPQNWSNTMLRFEVDIYDYNVGESVTYLIGGYSYFSGPNPNDGQWINHTAQFIGPRNRAMRVRFGHDGSYPCVYIGETSTVWSYPAVRVKDVNLGYLNIAESLWASGWSVSLATSVGTITQETSVPRAGDQVFGEGLLEAAPGSLLPGAGVVATRAAHRTDQGTAAFLNGEGPLARSLLTEDKVRGRYLGEYAGDAAAVTAGIENGDTYVDTSLTPYGFKVRSGGVIKEVDTSGLFKQFSTQVDINSTTMSDKVTLNLTNIQANSYMVVWMAMDVELTPSRTRKSGGTAGINPQGTWEIVEDATGGSSPKVLDSGTWEAVRIGSGGSADNIESFTVDGTVGEPTSDVSRSWRVRAGGSRTWKLRMKTNSGENLLSVGLNVLVQIQRNPA